MRDPLAINRDASPPAVEIGGMPGGDIGVDIAICALDVLIPAGGHFRLPSTEFVTIARDGHRFLHQSNPTYATTLTARSQNICGVQAEANDFQPIAVVNQLVGPTHHAIGGPVEMVHHQRMRS